MSRLFSQEISIPLAAAMCSATALECHHDGGVSITGSQQSLPAACDSVSPVYLWCPECQVVVAEPGSRDCGGLLCDVCNSNLVDTHGCVDCGKAVGSPEDDWCLACIAKWQRIDRADELTAVLVDIAMTSWRAA